MEVQQLTQFETGLAVSSPFYFGQGISDRLPEYLRRYSFDRCFLITSTKVMHLFGQPLLSALERHSIHCQPVLIDDTEEHKNWSTLQNLCEELVARGATRDSLLLALGGGVVGNVVGLAAALIYRGIRFVEIPTTVTAQTDSTLSNKQAINGAQGKNQFGVYHAPLFIWADADYPRTEPLRQQAAGVVEGVKNVFITQSSVGPAEKLIELWKSGEHFSQFLLELIESKRPIIARDPSEKASAISLEYGHTFGHAIEWLSRGRLLHGEAVSIGMCLAAELSHALGYASRDFVADHYRILGSRLGTPVHLPVDLSPTQLYETMLHDNKRTQKGLRFLLLKSPGVFVNKEGDYSVAADRELVLKVLDQSRLRSNEPEKLAG